MPSSTFLRLPPAKQERLMRATMDIFNQNGYARTRVEDVAAAAGVAKGSIYQYFEDKKALLTYCAQWGLQTYMERLEQVAHTSDMDIFTYFQASLHQSRVLQEEKSLVLFLQRLGKEPDLWDKAMMDALYQVSYGYIDRLLENSRQRGLVRADLPDEILREYFIGVTERFKTRWMALYLDFGKVTTMEAAALPLQTELNQMLELLKKGMGC